MSQPRDKAYTVSTLDYSFNATTTQTPASVICVEKPSLLARLSAKFRDKPPIPVKTASASSSTSSSPSSQTPLHLLDEDRETLI